MLRALEQLRPGAVADEECEGECEADGGSTLQTPLHLKARILSGREPCHCLLAKHTPIHCRGTLYLSAIFLCSHTSPGSVKPLV